MQAILDWSVLTWLPGEARTELEILTRILSEKFHDKGSGLLHGICNAKFPVLVEKAKNSLTCKSGSPSSEAAST